MTDKKSCTLLRSVGIGERLSFDGGRIVLTLQERTGRKACLRMSLHEDVVVDKPPRQQEPVDPPCNMEIHG